MRKLFTLLPIAALVLAFAPTAEAQSGHFVTGGTNAPQCSVQGSPLWQLLCSGKVAGLGGTTFEIKLTADGNATVQCRNRGGNIAPGQNTTFNADGSTGELATPQNGQYNFTVYAPSGGINVPSTPTCPNNSWTPEVTGVTYSNVVLTLWEDGILVATYAVPGTFSSN
jgi:hypothetical protein